MEKLIERINALARKSRSEELTDAEKAEQAEQALERENNVSRATTIKQLVGLSVSNISEELLEKAVTNVQKTLKQKELVEKAYDEVHIAGLDFCERMPLLEEWATKLNEYSMACACFTHILLGQVFTWLEGAGK